MKDGRSEFTRDAEGLQVFAFANYWNYFHKVQLKFGSN